MTSEHKSNWPKLSIDVTNTKHYQRKTKFNNFIYQKIKAFESKVQYPSDVHVADVNPPNTEFDVVLIIVTVFK